MWLADTPVTIDHKRGRALCLLFTPMRVLDMRGTMHLLLHKQIAVSFQTCIFAHKLLQTMVFSLLIINSANT